MNLEIILVGIIVGIANFASRVGPFFVIQNYKVLIKNAALSG